MLIGPFTQLLTMSGLPLAGPLLDEQITIIPEAGIRIADGKIVKVGIFKEMQRSGDDLVEVHQPSVAIPGLIDTHTHICYAGNRAKDYALRVSGVSYNQIALAGGGILDTVRHTRKASKLELIALLKNRAAKHLACGVTTCEVKSGYGLTVDDEVKQLEAICEASQQQPLELIPTCLAAHTRPPEYTSNQEYLNDMVKRLFPLLKSKSLSERIDIFVDEIAFTIGEARKYLLQAKEAGFNICLHANQFSAGGARLAADLHAVSADHLELCTKEDAAAMRQAGVIPVVLPGSSLGLGSPFPPARLLLDEGLPLVIASDWNPGSAPMGDLLVQASLLGAAEKLTLCETLASLTVRAASALSLFDRGKLIPGAWADLAVFPSSDYREIFYYQGAMKPLLVIKKGESVWQLE